MSMQSEVQRYAVRRAIAGDIRTLVELMDAFYAESNFPLDEQWASTSFEKLLSNPMYGSIWLAHQDGIPLGHAVLTVRYTMEHGSLSGYIDDLYVKPEFRHQGVGRALLDEIFSDCRARHCKAAYVEVGETNIAALALYARFGLLPVTDGRLLASGSIPK